ncbi:MAG: hypothetical protein QOD76_1675 [Solirubrobacteraceae bacterium]|nr:hypothetical protein [Solirubrobacteraceae bacterium]
MPSDLDSVLVTVWGRWLGSRPATPGLPVLVIKDGPLSHRFGALPTEWQTEAGVAGPFRAEFSIPSELREKLEEPLVLDLGAAEVPLPADRPRVAAHAPDGEAVVDPLELAERRAQRAQLAERAQAQRAEEAERARDAVRKELDELNERLRTARERRADLQAELADRARSLRATTQYEHAERALREELVADERAQREAAEEEARELRARFSEAEARARELVQDVEALRRAQLEAEQATAAAEAARREREHKLEVRERRVAAAEAAAGTSPDLEALAQRAAVLDEQLQRERAERSLVRTQLADERERAIKLEGELTSIRGAVDEKSQELALAASLISDLVSAGELLIERLEEERELSEHGERDLEARVEELTRRLDQEEHRRDDADRKLARTLCELSDARAAGLERPRRRAKRVQVNRARTWTARAPSPPATEPTAQPWLPLALERMLATDRAAAAELLVALLPAQAQGAGAPKVNYDLRLAELGTYRVSLARGYGTVEPLENPRGRRAANFRLETDAGGLLALLLDGGARQRGGERRVAVRGTLRRHRSLRRLPPVRMAPAEMARAGVWLKPELLYGALSHLVDAEWAAGHDFWIAHEITEAGDDTCHLHVGPGGLAVQVEAPPEQPAARIRTSRAHVQLVLGGEQPLPDDRAVVSGDADAVETLGRIVERAQGRGAAPETAPV